MCDAYFVLWKTVHGDVSHGVDMAIGNVERQCQTTASNKKLSLFRKEGQRGGALLATTGALAPQRSAVRPQRRCGGSLNKQPQIPAQKMRTKTR